MFSFLIVRKKQTKVEQRKLSKIERLSGQTKKRLDGLRSILQAPGLGPVTKEFGILVLLKDVTGMLERLARAVNSLDPRMNMYIELGGSSFECTKTGLPDEFDARLKIGGLEGQVIF